MNSLRPVSIIRERSHLNLERPGAVVSWLRTPLLTSAFYLSCNAGLGAVLGSVFWLVAARLYSPSAIGLASTAVSALLLLATLGDLGFDYALMRFASADARRAGEIANLSFTIGGAATLVGASIFVAGLSFWSPAFRQFNGLAIVLILFLAAAPCFTLSNLLDAALISQRASHLVLVKNLLANVLRFPMVCALLSFGAAGLFAGMSLSVAGVALLTLVVLPEALSGYRFRPILQVGLVREMLSYGVKNHAVNIVSSLPMLLLPMLVLNRLGATSSGYFAIAWLFITPIIMVLASVSAALLSEGARHEQRYTEDVRHAVAMVLPALAVIALAGALFAHPLLLLFGSAYGAAGDLLRLLLLSMVPGAVNSIFQARCRIEKRTMPILWLAVASAAITLIGASLLMPPLHLLGVGIAVLAGQLLPALYTGPLILRRWAA